MKKQLRKQTNSNIKKKKKKKGRKRFLSQKSVKQARTIYIMK